MKKFFIFFIIFNLLLCSNSTVFAAGYTLVPQFLCEQGVKLYNQGNYDAAIREFNKALMASPGYPPALEYIEKIRQKAGLKPEEKITPVAPAVKIIPQSRAGAIKELLDRIERERGLAPSVAAPAVALAREIIPKKAYPSAVLILDDSLKELKFPLEIEQGKSITILGKNIQRFLVTQPDVLSVEKKTPDELLVTGKDIGYTYLHVWDENGRWTTEFLGVFPKIEDLLTYEERLREEERARNFKLRYTLGWSSYESGRRIDSLERSSYAWSHGLNLTGETPYGDISSSASIRSLKTSTDLTYFTLGLTKGKIGPFQGFSLRGFDYGAPFSNLSFPGAALRGVMLSSPVLDNKLNYTAFWGREGGGRYGDLSPSLTKSRHSFLDGFNLNFSPTRRQNYRFSLVHGWGRDREDYLNDYAYDLSSNWNFANWRLGYEIAQDSEKFAQILNTYYTQPKLNLSAEFRNINNDFLSITGSGWRQGELGGLINLNYTPSEKITMSSNLEVYRDRLYPAQENDNRWNEMFGYAVSFRLDPLTSASLSYSLQNMLGSISQSRYQSPGLGISHRFKFIKNIDTYVNYYHQESKNFSSPSSDYINERVYTGLRFNLIGDLSYYLNKEFNWLEARYNADHSRPNALETGLDWSGQILKSPFYSSARLVYRDEEDTQSTLTFLSGEDYLEGNIELSYRPTPGKEAYCSTRVRNVWAENPSVSKRIEASFNAGMRYLWDTGVHWESIGNIDGYVFKDLNSDGLRQRDEPPVDGVKVWSGKDKSQVTDILGYYKFTKVRARKAYMSIDTSTIPSGYVLTVPQIQEAAIAHGQTLRINFGISTRSEITGVVFEDVNGDGKFSPRDLAVKGVILILEDGSKTATNNSGIYSFSKAAPGKHTLTLDLHSLPIAYLPTVPIFKDLELFEGVSYHYAIPLKKIQK